MLGAGGCLLTEYCEGINNYFVPGTHCETYTTKESCLEQINSLLSNPSKMEKLSIRGHGIVYESQTYKHRVEEIIKDVYDK